MIWVDSVQLIFGYLVSLPTQRERIAMKSLTFSIDLKSVALGALLAGGLFTLVNFKPADKPATPTTVSTGDNRRYQVVISSHSRDIIIDTQTGRFLIERPGLGVPGWTPMDFEQLYEQKRK